MKRFVSEALPRVLPPAEYEKLLAEPQKVGFDVRGVEYAIAGVRFADPPSPSGMPEFVVLLKGNFNADSLLALAKLGLGTQNLQSRQETYGSKTLEIVNVEKLMSSEPKEGEERKPSPYPEMAAAALDANTLVLGVPAYVRATIDAAGGGQGQLRPALVNLATHDPQALWSLSAELPPSLPEYFKKLGIPANAEIDNMIGWFKQVSFSNGMDALNFTIRAAVGADSAEHASALSGIVNMGIKAAQSAAEADVARKKLKPRESEQARMALSALRTFTNRTEGNTLLLGVSVPQRTVAAIVLKEFVKKPAPAATRRGARRRAPRRK
ncbi:MAG: hypothetical protein LC802_08270 [Acidobacteria bacterium]|nr:hypothetical protein [Acidobacteriota bacterium]